MQEIINQYLQLLLSMFQYDVKVFSQVWIYAWVLVPAFVYFIFFIFKWVVLTAPIWVPFRMIFDGLKSLFKAEKTKK